MTDRAQQFIIAGIYSVIGLYLFVFGALVLSGVIDAYFEYTVSFLFNFYFPIFNFEVPAIIFTFAAVGSILGAYYFLGDVVKHYVNTKLRKNIELAQKTLPNAKKESKSDESINNTIGGILLVIGGYFLFSVVNSFLGYTPISLFDSIRVNPFDLRFPIIIVLITGVILWILSFYFFIEAFKDFRQLEKTQIGYIPNKNEIIE